MEIIKRAVVAGREGGGEGHAELQRTFRAVERLWTTS